MCCSVFSVSLPLSVTEQSLSTTPGPTRHNIYFSQAANAAPLLLSHFKHSISLTSLGSRANILVDCNGFTQMVCYCLKCMSQYLFSLAVCCRVNGSSFFCCNEGDTWSERERERGGEGGIGAPLFCSLAVTDNERHIAHSEGMCW